MQFHVLTLFPEMIRNGCDSSILKRAMDKNLIRVNALNIRDFSKEKHGKVDDYTYGGGAGMLMQAQPVYDAWLSLQKHNQGKSIRTIYVTPQGRPLTQRLVKEFAQEEELILLCGHYEGIDERVLEEIVTDRISIGDYVLTGGELPALVMIDAISRLVPDVLGSEESAGVESFEKDLLEYPQYSRPEVWHGVEVPRVLLSGNHKMIEAWRLEQAKKRTSFMRPDLYERYERRQALLQKLLKHKKENAYFIDGLMKDMVDVLYEKGESVAGIHKKTKIVMICANSVNEVENMLPFLPKDCRGLLHNCEEANDLLEKEMGLIVGDACYQSVYTQHVSLPIAHKDIRPYPMEEIAYASENYGAGSQEDYIRERILDHAFFAAYEEGRIVGFCGIHGGGSLGLLFVDPSCRRGNIGSSLASYLVNAAMERGGFPYAHIRIGNEASLKMQEKMGLYVANKKIFWLWPKKVA